MPSFYVFSQLTVGMQAQFRAQVFDCYGYTTHQYIWNFGDGSAPLEGQNLKEVFQIYTSPGPHTVTLTVMNPPRAARYKFHLSYCLSGRYVAGRFHNQVSC